MKKLLLIILFITGVCFGQTYQLAEEFYENGLPKAIKTYKVSKGKIELVKAITWHENGQKEKEGTYKDGKKDGLWTEWNWDGWKLGEETYKDGKEDLRLKTKWYEDGQKEEEGTYKDGKKDGLRTYWLPNGQKFREGTFKDGELLSYIAYLENGTIGGTDKMNVIDTIKYDWVCGGVR